MSLIQIFTPKVLVGAGSDEWITGAGDTLTFRSNEGVNDVIFDAGPPPRFQFDATRYFHQTAGDQSWLSAAHNAGAKGGFDWWMAPGALHPAFNASYIMSTNQAGTPDKGVGLHILPGVTSGSMVLRWAGGEFNLGANDAFDITSTLEFFPGDFTQLGMSFEQSGSLMTARFSVNGVTEELTNGFIGRSGAASFEPHIGVGVGTGGHTHNNFFIGQFGAGFAYDTFLTEAELAQNFIDNQPGSTVKGTPPPPITDVTKGLWRVTWPTRFIGFDGVQDLIVRAINEADAIIVAKARISTTADDKFWDAATITAISADGIDEIVGAQAPAAGG